MKKCFKCKTVKPTDEFYVHPTMADGHLNKCKSCTKKDTVDRVLIMSLNPTWLAMERSRHRIKQAKYRTIGCDVKPTQAVRQKWADKNPEKIRAQRLCNYAVRIGAIKKQKRCERCGNTGKIEKHHEDYSKPLEIEWLCSKCHGETRRKLTA